MENISKLKDQIKEANRLYRVGEPIMSDTEFDDLVDELALLDPHDSLLKEVGYIAPDDSRKQKLPIIMASMNKIKTIEEYFTWLRLKGIPEDTEMVITPKYDGLSFCVLENGSHEAFTRGDGSHGQFSPKHYAKVNPDKTNHGNFYSFGEIIMSRKNFEKHKDQFKNPRNLVSGKINDKHASDILKDCDYIRYGLQGDYALMHKSQALKVLNEINKIQVPYIKKEAKDITEGFLLDLFAKWSTDYEIDGLIIEVDDYGLREKLGRETSSQNPCYARAFKGNFEMVKESTVLSITRQISKQSFLKPVAQIEPIELDGATVKNVTGINEKFVVGYRLKVGSKVKVKRSGMVIPLITEIDGVKVEKDKNGNYLFPYSDEKLNVHQCPVCNGEVAWNENHVEAICVNPSCEGSSLQKIISFFETLEVDGVSDGICEIFFNHGYDTIEKILKMTKDDMLKLDSFAERKAQITYENIHSKMKNIPLSRLQHASGCFVNLGSKKLALLEHFEHKPTIEEIIAIEGFSDISARAYLDGIDKFHTFVKDLPITIAKTEKIMATSSKLSGKTYVFTGVRRSDLETVIVGMGGKIGSSVSKNTTHLIMKEKGSGSQKEAKALELGLEILTVEELEELLKQ